MYAAWGRDKTEALNLRSKGEGGPFLFTSAIGRQVAEGESEFRVRVSITNLT